MTAGGMRQIAESGRIPFQRKSREVLEDLGIVDRRRGNSSGTIPLFDEQEDKGRDKEEDDEVQQQQQRLRSPRDERKMRTKEKQNLQEYERRKAVRSTRLQTIQTKWMESRQMKNRLEDDRQHPRWTMDRIFCRCSSS